MLQIFGKGFNYSQDGPGNRLVYHLSGCNMKCIWCSNPEGMDANAGTKYTVQDIIEECRSCKMMFFSGGGVTFTGGEATLQYEELFAVLKALKKEGIHTAIETNGTSAWLSNLLPFIDYLIMDFKHYDSAKLKEFTGVGNARICDNFEHHCKISRQQHIRIPLINGFNTDSPQSFAKYFSKFDTSSSVFEFLPYHEYGKEKWKGAYQVQNGFITDDILQSFIDTFINYNLKIVRT